MSDRARIPNISEHEFCDDFRNVAFCFSLQQAFFDVNKRHLRWRHTLKFAVHNQSVMVKLLLHLCIAIAGPVLYKRTLIS